MRARYRSSGERKRQQARQWAKNNQKRRQELNRKWAAKNQEQAHKQRRRWRLANPEKDRNRKALWTQANPGKAREHHASRRARKRAATVPLTSAERALIAAKYIEAARLTAVTGIPHDVDHDKPLARGGVHHPSNLIVVPASLNRAKGARYNSTLDFILS